MSRLAGLLTAALLAGCATTPWVGAARPPAPPAESLLAYYHPRPTTFTVARDPLGAEPSSRWRAERITLTSPDLPQPIRLDWYAPPQPGRHAAVLIFPILWGNDLGVRDFAQGFARQGIHGIIVYRPKEKFSMEKPLGQLEDHLHTSVLLVRHAIDWLETQPAVDTGRLGSLGISMGGALNILVAAVEPRITRYAFLLPAARLAHVTMTTKDRSIAKKRREYLARYGLTAEAAEQELTRTLRSEPLAVARSLDPRRTLLVVALADRVIGGDTTRALRNALGRPPTLWLPTGHYSSILALPYVRIKILLWFGDWRAPPPD